MFTVDNTSGLNHILVGLEKDLLEHCCDICNHIRINHDSGDVVVSQAQDFYVWATHMRFPWNQLQSPQAFDIQSPIDVIVTKIPAILVSKHKAHFTLGCRS